MTNFNKVKYVVSQNILIFYHAAAYKHVPMVEKNITEGVYNNVIGTYNLALSAHECDWSKQLDKYRQG